MAITEEVKLKLLIDTKSERVLFAEADKKVVYFLFNLLSLPVASVIELLNKKNMVGSLPNLYQSVENLDDTYLQPNQSKNYLLKPKVSISCSANLLPNIESYSSTPPEFYLCSVQSLSYCRDYYADDPTAVCPECNNKINRVVTYVPPPGNSSIKVATAAGSGGSGFVKGVVTYMVMDDLRVKPMSVISSLTLLNEFNIKDVGVLEDKVVTLDINQGVKLLQVSLQSKTVLTDVFLGKKL